MSKPVTGITDALGVLGRAIAVAAVARGDAVAAIDFTPGERADSDDWMGLGNVDLTDPAAAQTAVNAVVERFGRIDSLLNAVGGFVWQTADGPLENWDPAAGQGVRRRTASLARPGRRDGGGWGQ